MHNPLIVFGFASILGLGISACQKAGVPRSPASEGEIVFTEVMPLLQPGDHNWVELQNTSTDSLNLQHCTLTNQAKQLLTITSSLIIEAGNYSVISSEIADGKQLPEGLDYPDVVYLPQDFQLLADGEIHLDCNSQQIDQLRYRAAPPTLTDRIRSWQRHARPTDTDSDPHAGTWCHTVPLEDFQYNVNRFATPGRPNSFCASLMPFIAYDDQQSVLVDSIDLDATLQVAEAELARKIATSELPIWGIRDQIITPAIARRISELYFANIDMLYETTPFTAIDWNHAVWHFAWAISNMYRNGNQTVKDELKLAYEDALRRPETLHRYKYIAIDYIRGERIVMGDTHSRARNRMQELIVAPGNPDYLNSYDEYMENRRSPFLLSAIHYLYVASRFFSDLRS
jgi:hypothetical protein